jgi:DNA-binding XRE family transcriptional regulator
VFAGGASPYVTAIAVLRKRRPSPRPRQPRRPSADATVLREAGERIRRARVRAKLTQETAASRANIDYKRWQALETGRANPTLRTLVRVATALEIDVWELLGPSLMDDAAASRRK